MSCIYDIVKDIFVDCIFCNTSDEEKEEKEETEKRHRPKRKHLRHKSTQTEDVFKEPGS